MTLESNPANVRFITFRAYIFTVPFLVLFFTVLIESTVMVDRTELLMTKNDTGSCICLLSGDKSQVEQVEATESQEATSIAAVSCVLVGVVSVGIIALDLISVFMAFGWVV